MKRTFSISILLLCLHGIAHADFVTKLYVPSGVGSATTIVYGLESQTVINQISSMFEIGSAAANSDSSEVWLFGDHSTYVNVVDVASDRVTRTIDATIVVTAAAFSPDGKYCFAVGKAPDKAESVLMAIDAVAKEILYSIGGFVAPGAVVVAPDSRSLYVTSRLEGQVIKIAIPSFQVAKTIAVGPEPADLAFAADGRLLFAACQGLDGGRRGGSQLAIIDVATDKLVWIENDIGRAPASLEVSGYLGRLVMTYAFPQIRPQANIRVFNYSQTDRGFAFEPAGSLLFGESPAGGAIIDAAKLWIGSDRKDGLALLDLANDNAKNIPTELQAARPMAVTAVRVDVDARIRELQAAMSTAADNSGVADSFLDLAYLYTTAGRKNDVVGVYNKLLTDHPRTFAAIIAALRMSDITYEQQLFGQSAEFGMKALQTYGDFVAQTTDQRQPPTHDLLLVFDRVAKLGRQDKQPYVKTIADQYLKLIAQNATLAELFYAIGYQLQIDADPKLARRCFTESQNRLGSLQDRMAMLTLSAKLALATGDLNALYKARDRKDVPPIDGDLTEWQKQRALSLNGDGGYVYGSALWTGVNDLSASFYVNLTKQDLVIAGNILDNVLLAFADGKTDAVNFYFDFRAGAASLFTRAAEFSDGCFRFTVEAPTATNPKARLRLPGSAAYEIGSQTTAGGYAFEARIPLTAFGTWFTPKTKRIGFGIEIVDYDTPDNSTLVKSLGYLLPTRDPNSTPDPTLFGLLEF